MFSCPALFSVLFILAQSITSAQEPKSAAAEKPRVDLGAYASDTYSNECLGFSFHMPAGWLAKSQGISGLARAIHQQGGGLNLLMIEQPKQGTFGNTIMLYATESKDQTPQDFVSNAVQAQIKHAPNKNQLLRDATVVEYGDRKFFRSDYKAALPYGGNSAYRSLVFTRFRNYLIGEMVNTGSEEELNRAVDSLRGISFRADTPNPSCEK
jgi:hypothetical protein